MTLELAIICVVAGAVLGLRYNVLVLVPAIAFAALFAVIVGVAQADNFWPIALRTAAFVVAVQLGYLAGVGIYAGVEAICAARSRGRNPELRSLMPVWSHSWHPRSWQLGGWWTLRSVIPLRQSPPPRV